MLVCGVGEEGLRIGLLLLVLGVQHVVFLVSFLCLLAGAGSDGFCAVFAGDVDPSVSTVAAEWGWGVAGGRGWGGGGVVEPAFGVEPGGWVGDVGGVLWAGGSVVVDCFEDGGGISFFEGGFPGFAGCAFADFAGVGVPEGVEVIIFG